MKKSFYQISGITFILLLLIVFNASAQEGGMPSNEIPDVNFRSDNTIDEKPLLTDPEKSNSERSYQNKDQIVPATRSSKPTPTNQVKGNSNSKEEEEDALSFNFLYYLIQKFKISDIVEQ